MAACPLPGATKSSTTWHKAHRRQVPAEALRSILGMHNETAPPYYTIQCEGIERHRLAHLAGRTRPISLSSSKSRNSFRSLW
jgi:hypothetical protein